MCTCIVTFSLIHLEMIHPENARWIRMGGSGGGGVRPPFFAHDVGFLTLGLKLDPLLDPPPLFLLVNLRWTPFSKILDSPLIRERIHPEYARWIRERIHPEYARWIRERIHPEYARWIRERIHSEYARWIRH